MRSLAVRAACAVVLVAACAPAAAAAPADAAAAPPAPAARSWAEPQIEAVLAAGLMSGDEQSFRPDDPLTRSELDELVANLTGAPVPAGTSDAPVTVAELDRRLVDALGLAPAAAEFAAASRAAGLRPPTRFGTEVVARLLGLRTNHPAKDDALELLPDDPVTRAETAFSAARILSFQGGEADAVAEAASTFALPPPTAWQRRILTTALSFVGFPYVWGGTSETTETYGTVTARGGFDCSGFVWRVYKLQRYAGAGAALASTLTGRTTAQMSGEVPLDERIALPDLQPADLLFFGPKGSRTKPAAIDHAAIYLGGGWFVHSSRDGVALTQLDGWWLAHFAWARRPLLEAGLADA